MISLKQITFLNEIGRRENIEDHIYPAPEQASLSDRLFLVCDGVGGESKGEVASQIACEEFSNFINFSLPGTDESLTGSYLKQAQTHVINKMSLYAQVHPDAEKMSTTLTLTYIVDDKILAAWCGDSRIYHLRNGKVMWRSSDHSLVGKLVEQGEITEDEAARHPQKNVILRSISASGRPSDIDHEWLTDVQDGDYILLCTDGVLEQIDESKLEKITTNPQTDKKGLFLEYCFGKTSDNFSLYMLELGNDIEETTPGINTPIGAPEPVKQPAAVASKKGSPVVLILILLVLVLLGVLGYYFATGRIKGPQSDAKPAAIVKPVIVKKVPDTTNEKGTDVVMPNLAGNDSSNTKKSVPPVGRPAAKGSGVKKK